MHILNLFPTAVGKFQLGRKITEKEKQFILNAEKRKGESNQRSVDNYILKNKALKNLSVFLQDSANEYFQNVYKPRSDVSLYITQSWLNYTNQGQYHHKHAHPNSFLSGVFYVETDSTKDKIHFYNEEYKQIQVPTTEWNAWNSNSFWLEARIGVLYMFPSSLIHMVEPVTSSKTRISLSFNTFLQGVIGNNISLTELKIGIMRS